METGQPTVERRLDVLRVFDEAFRVYRLLFVRSVTTAAVVFGLIALIDLFHHAASGGAGQLLAVIAFVLGIAGPVLVQGALVGIVRDVHHAHAPKAVGELLGESRQRLFPLVGAAIVYGLGVGLGLVLLVVPGLIVAARWSLLAPLIVLEGLGVGDARRRSASLVKGQTGRVLLCVGISGVIVASFPFFLVYGAHLGFGTATFAQFVWSALTAPIQAHVFTVLYYRLAEPEQPVIHPEVLRWHSVWEGR